MAEGVSSGKFVDLALAYSLGAGRKPDATCEFKLEDCGESRSGLHSWLPQCFGLDSLSLLISALAAGLLRLSCPVPSQPVWPACWIDTPGRFSSSSFFTSGCAGCLGSLS